MCLVGGLSMARFWGLELWTVFKVLLLGLVITCLCGLLWLVVKLFCGHLLYHNWS